jgi:hypothetical protein
LAILPTGVYLIGYKVETILTLFHAHI